MAADSPPPAPAAGATGAHAVVAFDTNTHKADADADGDTVHLTLVDISADVAAMSESDGRDGPKLAGGGGGCGSIESLVDEALRAGGAGCVEARRRCAYPSVVGGDGTTCSISIDDDDDAEVRERIKSSILRYVHLKDRYAALCSVLLKSRAFHQTMASARTFDRSGGDGDDGNAEEREEEGIGRAAALPRPPLPLVELPKTEYGKPYLPLPIGSLGGQVDDGNDNDNADAHVADTDAQQHRHTVSVSHQFPHVGLARLVPPSSQTVRHVGLDIVTFDAPRPRLYSSTSEFLEVFRKSFTAWEWDRITNRRQQRQRRRRRRWQSTATCTSSKRTDEHALREFYCRWAVKESYTKALGVGLGLEFGTFETRLVGIDDDNDDDDDEEDVVVDMADIPCVGEDEDGDDDGGVLGALDRLNFDPCSREEGGGGTVGGKSVGGHAALAPPLSVRGRVIRLDEQDAGTDNDASTEERWDYTFFGLPRAVAAASEVDCTSQMGGCACVCTGPIDEDGRVPAKKAAVTHIEWMTVADLIRK